MQTKWQKYLLIGTFATLNACTTTPQTKYETRQPHGTKQSEQSIKDEHRRHSDTFFNKSVQRINWDTWQ